MALIRDGPGIHVQCFSQAGAQAGRRMRSARCQKDRGQGGQYPSRLLWGYAGWFRAKKRSFDNQFHYLEEQTSWTKKKTQVNMERNFPLFVGDAAVAVEEPRNWYTVMQQFKTLHVGLEREDTTSYNGSAL